MLLYLSARGKLACADHLPLDLSVRERLAVAVLHRWESDWDDHHNDNNEGDNPRTFAGDGYSVTQCDVIEIEDSDPDS